MEESSEKNAPDKVRLNDTVDADLSREHRAPKSPCPACGAESKEGHVRGTRICSKRNCRTEFGTPEPVSQEASAAVHLVISESRGAEYPCPKCQHETKEDQLPGSRICSNRACRHKILPS